MRATFLVPSKIWRIKHLRKRGPNKNMCNSECALKFSIVACKQLASKGIVHAHVCGCTKDEKQESVPARTTRGRPRFNKSNFYPACKHFAAAGWLSEEGGLTLLTSQLYSCFCGKETFLTALLVLPLLKPQDLDLCSALAQCEQHLSFACHVVLSSPKEKVITCSLTLHCHIGGSYLLCHNLWDNTGKVKALTLTKVRLQHNYFQRTFLNYFVAT